MATSKYREQPDMDGMEDFEIPKVRKPRMEPQRVEIVMPSMPQAIKTASGFFCELLALVFRFLEFVFEILGMFGRILDSVFSYLSGLADRARRYLIGIAHNL